MSSEPPDYDGVGACHSTVRALGEGTFFRTVAETTTEPLAVVDGEEEVVFANEAFCALGTRESDAVVGTSFAAYVEGELPDDGETEDGTLVETERPVRVTARCTELDGQRLTTVSLDTVDESAGRDAEHDSETRDEELQASQERYRRLLDAAPDAIVVADADDGAILDVNEAAEDLFGRSRDGLVGRPQTDLHPAEKADQYRAIFDRHVEAGGVLAEDEVQIVRNDGERVPVEINAGVTDLPGGTVVQAIFRDVSERTRRERALASHRDELARLNRVNRVIREIVQALVHAESREEVERTVCERLVAAEPYVCAWVGELLPGRSVVSARALAGDGGDFVDAETALDYDDGDGDCPIQRALATHEVQVVEDLETAVNDEDDWRAQAVESGFRSCAAVPIVHDGRRFGVLSLYADQPDGFDPRERAVLSDLGGALGHALNALERKAALMSDSALEIELQTSQQLPELIEEVGVDGRAVFERTIPSGDDYLLYVRVENISTDRFEAILEAYPWCRDVRRIREGTPAVYEIRSVQPSMTSRLASYGGRVKTTVVEDGALRIVAELPQNADVRELVEALREQRDDVELVAQRTVPRTDHPDRTRISLEETLSERQQSTLEVAYYAGYFEWPRDSTAEEVAESLGVSSPTVHKHLRHAHRRILGGLFDGSDSSLDGD